ncbi:MAG: hypothetical protein HWN81_16760 [Candidatus Lokiarchaeota archaeon]|nr:hypothetical protein [Candidatus Lokiarchaeota archaeon]
MTKLNKLGLNKIETCGVTMVLCGIAGYIVNFTVPTSSSWAYIYLLGPIMIAIGVIVSIIGAITGSIKATTKTDTNHRRKTVIEKIIYDYLRENRGKAYTIRALQTRLENIKFERAFTRDLKERKDYYENELRRILEKLVSYGDLQYNKHDGEIHYFYPPE